MTCGKCMHCRPEGICGGCLCDALDIEVSKDDDVRFYSERNGDGDYDNVCERFEEAD